MTEGCFEKYGEDATGLEVRLFYCKEKLGSYAKSCRRDSYARDNFLSTAKTRKKKDR